jgi:hypothetical protein
VLSANALVPLQELKVLAKDRDVPYQSLMKILLAEKVADLRRKAG